MAAIKEEERRLGNGQLRKKGEMERRIEAPLATTSTSNRVMHPVFPCEVFFNKVSLLLINLFKMVLIWSYFYRSVPRAKSENIPFQEKKAIHRFFQSRRKYLISKRFFRPEHVVAVIFPCVLVQQKTISCLRGE